LFCFFFLFFSWFLFCDRLRIWTPAGGLLHRHGTVNGSYKTCETCARFGCGVSSEFRRRQRLLLLRVTASSRSLRGARGLPMEESEAGLRDANAFLRHSPQLGRQVCPHIKI
jgi:hypothetical protein